MPHCLLLLLLLLFVHIVHAWFGLVCELIIEREKERVVREMREMRANRNPRERARNREGKRERARNREWKREKRERREKEREIERGRERREKEREIERGRERREKGERVRLHNNGNNQVIHFDANNNFKCFEV